MTELGGEPNHSPGQGALVSSLRLGGVYPDDLLLDVIVDVGSGLGFGKLEVSFHVFFLFIWQVPL